MLKLIWPNNSIIKWRPWWYHVRIVWWIFLQPHRQFVKDACHGDTIGRDDMFIWQIFGLPLSSTSINDVSRPEHWVKDTDSIISCTMVILKTMMAICDFEFHVMEDFVTVIVLSVFCGNLLVLRSEHGPLLELLSF